MFSEGMELMISLGVTILLVSLVFYYFRQRIAVLENLHMEHARVLQSFIVNMNQQVAEPQNHPPARSSNPGEDLRSAAAAAAGVHIQEKEALIDVSDDENISSESETDESDSDTDENINLAGALETNAVDLDDVVKLDENMDHDGIKIIEMNPEVQDIEEEVIIVDTTDSDTEDTEDTEDAEAGKD